MKTVSIVMYHYVRPLVRSRYPEIKGRDLKDFQQQVAYLQRVSTILSLDDLLDALKSRSELPTDVAVLTFDDGFADHYTHALPVLHEAGVSGAFFPPARPVLEHLLLDVHRVHFILASIPTVEQATGLLDDIIRDNADVCASVDAYRKQYCSQGRLDDAETIYLKRMLQVGLPQPLRSEIAAQIFSRFVSSDETAFAEELYLSKAQLRLMDDLGMHIGSHGYNHLWLAHSSPDEQREDLAKSLEFLRGLRLRRESNFTLCYPYGSYDDQTVSIARSLGFIAAVTTEAKHVDPVNDSLFRLPRFDTNDVPLG